MDASAGNGPSHGVLGRNRGRWVAAGVLIFILLCSRSVSQFQFVILLAVSLLSMGWFGHRVLAWLGLASTAQGPGLFLKAWLGQFALLLVWLVSAPLAWAWTSWADLPLALPFMVMAALSISLLLHRTQARGFARSLVPSCSGSSLPTLLGLFALVATAALYSRRAGALGLDTHQHIAFTTAMYEAGYPLLTAGGTAWLEKYPKLLHVLASLWAWPGMGHHLGPFLKVQPALQATLAVVGLTELVWGRLRSRGLSPALLMAGGALLLAGLGALMLRGTTYFYPVADLNSTGRLSALAVLLLPALAATLHGMARNRRSAAFCWAALPFAGAMAVKLNPSLAVAYAGFSVPLFLCVAVFPWLHTRGLSLRLLMPLLGLFTGTAAGVVLLLADPYYLQLVAEAVPEVRAGLQQFLGLRLYTPPSVALVEGSLPEALRAAVMWELWHGPQPAPWTQWMPDSSQFLWRAIHPLGHALALASIAAGLAALLWRRWAAESRRLLVSILGWQIGLLLSVLCAQRLANIVLLALGHSSLEASLLSTYSQRYIDLLGMYALLIQSMLALASLLLLLDAVGAGRHLRALPKASLRRATAIVVALGALAFAVVPPPAPRARTMGWPYPVDEKQVRAFQQAEARLPADAVVLVPAYSVMLNGREDWVLPSASVAPYLPFGQRDYLFNVRLGAGYPFTARDLRQLLCSNKPAAARQQLRRLGVTHVLIDRSDRATDRDMLETRLCMTELGRLGLSVQDAIAAPGGLFFYPLQP